MEALELELVLLAGLLGLVRLPLLGDGGDLPLERLDRDEDDDHVLQATGAHEAVHLLPELPHDGDALTDLEEGVVDVLDVSVLDLHQGYLDVVEAELEVVGQALDLLLGLLLLDRELEAPFVVADQLQSGLLVGDLLIDLLRLELHGLLLRGALLDLPGLLLLGLAGHGGLLTIWVD